MHASGKPDSGDQSSIGNSNTPDKDGNTYYENGNLKSSVSTDENGNIVEKDFNEDGSMSAQRMTDKDGNKSWETYDKDGNKKTEGTLNTDGIREENTYQNGKLRSMSSYSIYD